MTDFPRFNPPRTPALPLLGLALIVLLPVTPAQARLEIQVGAGNPPEITLLAEREPLARVLQGLAEAADFDLEIDGDLGRETGSWQFRQRPLDRVLESLTRGLGLTVFYGHLDTESRSIIEVQVHGRSAPGGPAQAARPGTRAPNPPPAAQPATDDKNERRQALQSLAGSNDAGNLELIAAYLRDDPAPDIRRQAIDMLTRQGAQDITSWLGPCLSDSDPGIRVHCINAMSQVRSAEVTASIGQMLFNESELQVRVAVVRALARQNDEQAGQMLEAAALDTSLGVESEAQAALRQWRSANGRGAGEEESTPGQDPGLAQ